MQLVPESRVLGAVLGLLPLGIRAIQRPASIVLALCCAESPSCRAGTLDHLKYVVDFLWTEESPLQLRGMLILSALAHEGTPRLCAWYPRPFGGV